jgi:hypothetical protein
VWSASRPVRFTPREKAPGTRWIGGWVGPRACLEKRRIYISATYVDLFETSIKAEKKWSGSPVGTDTKLRARRPGFNSWQGQGVFFFSSSPPRPDRLCAPSSLLSDGYRRLFPREYSGESVKLTTHLHLVPSLRMRGA